MNRWIPLGLLVGALAIASIAAGCGGGNDTSTAALTKAEFIKQGDAICARADQAQAVGLKTYTKGGQFPNTPAAQEEMVIAVGLPPVQTAVEELRDLGVPSGDAAKVKSIVVGMENALERAEQDPGSVVTGAGNPFVEVDQLAREYGFKACADPL